VVIQYTADSPEIADGAIEEMLESRDYVKQSSGCLQFELFRSTLRPEQWVLLEHWESKEAQAAHRQRVASVRPPPRPGVERVREEYEYQVTPAPAPAPR
jgi:quinol monooxygenase YgiN